MSPGPDVSVPAGGDAVRNTYSNSVFLILGQAFVFFRGGGGVSRARRKCLGLGRHFLPHVSIEGFPCFGGGLPEGRGEAGEEVVAGVCRALLKCTGPGRRCPPPLLKLSFPQFWQAVSGKGGGRGDSWCV